MGQTFCRMEALDVLSSMEPTSVLRESNSNLIFVRRSFSNVFCNRRYTHMCTVFTTQTLNMRQEAVSSTSKTRTSSYVFS